MKRITLVIFIIFVAGCLLILGVFYVRSMSAKYSWRPRYQHQSKEPYDTRFIFEMLKDSYGDSNFILVNKSPEKLINDTVINSLYFNIGFRTYYDSATVQWFVDYIRRGNKAFFASENIPSQILENVFGLDSSYIFTNLYNDSIIHTLFIDDSNMIYKFHFQDGKKKKIYSWKYLPDSCLNHYWMRGLIEPLSVIDSGRVNFIEINYGQGTVYILTTPLLLTNYYLIKKEGFEYASDVFEKTGKANTIYWDNFNHFSLPQDIQDEGMNPLKFFLSQKSLRWGWYLTIIVLIFFFIFHLKRRQKPILIKTPDKNTSIEYAKTVGLLHYRTDTHGNLSEQLMRIFLSYTKGRYKINLSDGREEDIKIISFHSGIDAKHIKDIFTNYYLIKHDSEPSKSDTIKLYSLLEYFYKNCK